MIRQSWKSLMNDITSKLYRNLLSGVAAAALLANTPVHAQETNLVSVTDTNALELIRQLQQRVNELEQKLNQLQSNKPPVVIETHTNDQQRIEELDFVKRSSRSPWLRLGWRRSSWGTPRMRPPGSATPRRCCWRTSLFSSIELRVNFGRDD